MARYKNVFYQDEWYGLKKGETLEQLLQLEKVEPLLDMQTTEVQTDLWVSCGSCLMRRSSYRRSHHKLKPAVEKPKFGHGSGRAGGGRTGTHYRSHVRFFPGTTPVDCPACKRGLHAVLADQGKVLEIRGRTFWTREMTWPEYERVVGPGDEECQTEPRERTLMIHGKLFRWTGQLHGWQDASINPMAEVEI